MMLPHAPSRPPPATTVPLGPHRATQRAVGITPQRPKAVRPGVSVGCKGRSPGAYVRACATLDTAMNAFMNALRKLTLFRDGARNKWLLTEQQRSTTFCRCRYAKRLGARPTRPKSMQAHQNGRAVRAAAPGPSLPSQPIPDAEHIQLYYKTRDDFKEQSAAADTRALTILTIEGALVAALIAAALIITWLFAFPTGTHDIFSKWVPSFSGRAALADFPIVAHVFVGLFALASLIVAGIWFLMSTVMVYGSMYDVLKSDFQFQAPPVSFWKQLRLIVFMRQSHFLPQPTPEKDRSSAGLPFSPYALLSAQQDLSKKMAVLDVPEALIADIKAKAAIVQDKRLALQQGMRAFAIQLFALFILVLALVLGHTTLYT